MKINNIKRFIISTLCLFSFLCANSQQYEKYFSDSTLRIDYTFSGNAKQQNISLDELCISPHWYGRHHRLSELPIEGNGQITVKCHNTGNVIYRNSFSTLFQEWLSYDEAKQTSKSFQNVFLVPFPKDTVDITVDIRNNRREIMSSFTHTVSPKDILIRHVGFHYVTPYITINQASDTTNCIHIAYLAEGYTENEMSTFIDDAKKAMEALFSHEPFKSMRNRFNIIAVKASSKDSGTSEPAEGIWKNTALHSHFDTFYSDRYLTTLNIKDMHDLLAGTPYEHIIVLVNTDKYGGGGILNSYHLSMTHHKSFLPVVVHEFGHSFAGLADEYAYDFEQIPMYPHDIEPWEPNITTLIDFPSKWKNMLPKNIKIPTPAKNDIYQIGVYEGAGYSLKGVYRAYPNCRMRSNEVSEFCPVCQRAIARLIEFYTK